MCSAAFYYPAEEIFKASRDALMRKGYRILEEDLKNGYLKARSKFSFFKRSYHVELNIVSQDSISTLNLSSGDAVIDARNERERFEYERNLIDTVYKMIRARDVN